ncbi:MAG: hypothetical protein KC620_19950 [Myxococcales bacterium]|nr:hypothetical protein [Myxococcales bacterium]
MDAVSRRIVDRLVDRIVRQPKPCDALLRFVYYTEEFVERYDIEGVLPHLTDDERDAMRKHFRDEMAHSVALRRYCQEEGLPIERSPLEEALIQRSDEGYAQYLRHLDPATNRFTPAEMYAYYAHVNVQEDVANVLYSAVANALERHGVHTRFVKLLRAFAKSEIKHQDYADDFMSKYEAQLGRAQCRRIYLRTRVQSLTLGAGYLREFLRILVVEHDLDIGPFGWLVRRLPAPAAAA